MTQRSDTEMMSIHHNGSEYTSGTLIPVALGPMEVSRATFKLKFFCRSSCHKVGPFELGVKYFTRGKPSLAREVYDGEKPSLANEVYGVHQSACSRSFPVDLI